MLASLQSVPKTRIQRTTPCASVHAAPARSSAARTTGAHRSLRTPAGKRSGSGPLPAVARSVRAMASASDADADIWRLYYWPGIKGRGEYVRLCFEEAGVPYIDVAAAAAAGGHPPPAEGGGGAAQHPGFRAVAEWCFERGADGTHNPVRAPPAVARRGFALCNTPAVCSFLNDELGWGAGLSREQRASVDQVLGVILSDAVGEGRLAFHPKDFYASHRTQVDACPPFIEQYGTKRLPKYVDFLEATLAWNNEQRPGAAPNGFLVGPGLTAADLVAWHYLCALEQHYKEWYCAAVARARRASRPSRRRSGRGRGSRLTSRRPAARPGTRTRSCDAGAAARRRAGARSRQQQPGRLRLRRQMIVFLG
ncbi:MAG: hypothetical protein J3K34DRAFT_269062 [Monoraphidium minutum]|nr:MAG: hypothetical protein J3K34DRAFT_269062 [Monoraphidium minutum]